MKDETVESLGTRLLLMFPVAMDSQVNNISADCTTHHLSQYKSTRNSQKYFGNAANVIWGGKISILLPDYFLSFLEAWEWDETIDDITFITIFWHQSMFSLDIQLAICTMSFYYYIQNLSGFCFLGLLLFNFRWNYLIQIWIQRKNQKDSGCSS